MSYRGASTLNGPLHFNGTASPGLAPASEGRIYYDSATNRFLVSENGGAYVNLAHQTLAQVLTEGNVSGASDILMTTGQAVDTATAAAQLELGTTNAGSLSIGTALGTTSTFQVLINQGGTSWNSNAGLQLSSTQANRGSGRFNQFGANTGVPGVTGFKSRGTNVGDLASVADGDILARMTAIGVAPDNASIPLAGFVDIRVPTGGTAGTNWVASDFSVSLVPLAGPINSIRQVSRITSEAAFELIDGTTAAVSPANVGQLRYNNTTKTFQQSVDGGAWTSILTSGSSGWTDDGAVVRLTTVSDAVGIGTATPAAASKLEVLGDATRKNVFLTGGAATGVDSGGSLVFTAGAGGPTGNGGVVGLTGGPGGSTSGSAGGITLLGGTATDGDGGTITISGSAGLGTNRNGGSVTIASGSSTGTGDGGTSTMTGGASAAATGTPGRAIVRGGAGFGTGTGASGTILGGVGGATGAGGNGRVFGGNGGSTSGDAGGVELSGGTPNDGNGGSITINATAGVGTDRSGGDVGIVGGASTGTGTAGTVNIVGGARSTGGSGGGVSLTGGAMSGSGVGGSVNVLGGSGGGATGTGGTVAVQGGTGSTNGAGGVLNLFGGDGAGSGSGGQANFRGGQAGATGTGGAAAVIGGLGGSTSGSGGSASVTGGTPTDGDGGSVYITASDGVGTNRNGGEVAIASGNLTGSGAGGAIRFSTLGSSERARITPTGRLGVGTTSPVATADIDGSVALGDITTVSGNTTLDDTHAVVLVDASGGAITITLPAVSGITRRRYTIKKIDSSANAVTIDGNGAETIDGSATQSLATQYDALEVVTNGTEWFVV